MKKEMLVDKGNSRNYLYYKTDGSIIDVIREGNTFYEYEINKELVLEKWKRIDIKKWIDLVIGEEKKVLVLNF